MTIRNLAHYQFNAIRNNCTSNMATPIRSQQSNIAQVNRTVNSAQMNQVKRANSDSLQFLNQYKSKMDGLASAADKIRSLSKDGVWSNLEISSSDMGVVSNATTYGKVPQRAECDIDVKQLAQRQISTIAAPTTGFMDGQFSIQIADDKGKATVMADVDTEKLAKYTEQFVETYNKTIDFLVENAHRGSGVSKALDRLMQAPVSKDAMSSIGLNFGRDGKITFDAKDFDKAMKEDTRMVYDILADNYSAADTIYQKAEKASNNSSASLLDNSKLENSNGDGVVIINNYNYFSCPSPFGFSGSLFFNARVKKSILRSLNLMVALEAKSQERTCYI